MPSDLELLEETVETPKVSENWIVMSNALVRAAHNLSLKEKQVMMLAISKIDSKQSLRSFDSKSQTWSERIPSIKITVAEFAEAYDLDPNSAYKDLRSACNRFYERSVSFQKRDDQGNVVVSGRCRWIGSQRYHDGAGWAELMFWPQLLPHLMNLKSRFTKIQLKQVANLRSKHSWKLMELLKQMTPKDGTSVLSIGINEFNHSMEVTDKQRGNFNNIKRRIIEPAVKELVEKDNWLIDWRAIKVGRKVERLEFRFFRNPQGSLFAGNRD